MVTNTLTGKKISKHSLLCAMMIYLIFPFTLFAEKGNSDRQLLLQGRLLFEKNKLDEAIETYSKIPVSSDFWLEALEERAWAHTRNKDYPKALADLKSVTHPVWSAQVGPESIMLSAFVSLKICAYKDTLEKIELFKKRMISRVTALENLQKNPVTPGLMKNLQLATDKKMTVMELGKSAELYPRYFFRDQKLLQAYSVKDLAKMSSRISDLIDRDMNEIQKNLTKMKVIEIEVIQRVSTTKEIKQTKKNLSFSRYDKSQQVSFPILDDEVWLDEMGSFEVKSQHCL
ncbi:MAG: hypothetical protein ACK5P5_12725 [Pseudobdellovibrionaceae bacterium]